MYLATNFTSLIKMLTLYITVRLSLNSVTFVTNSNKSFVILTFIGIRLFILTLRVISCFYSTYLMSGDEQDGEALETNQNHFLLHC